MENVFLVQLTAENVKIMFVESVLMGIILMAMEFVL